MKAYGSYTCMNNQKQEKMKKVIIPLVLVSNTYYWHPGSTASQRRANEQRRMSEALAFFKSIGFSDEIWPEKLVIPEDKNIKGAFSVVVEFSYSESSRNVYKTFSVHVKGRKSNIIGLMSQMKRRGIELVKP